MHACHLFRADGQDHKISHAGLHESPIPGFGEVHQAATETSSCPQLVCARQAGTPQLGSFKGRRKGVEPRGYRGQGWPRQAYLDRLVAKATKAKSSPFLGPLPDTHESRNVEQCRHCGIGKWNLLYNQDDVRGSVIGFRAFVQRICGLACPGHVRPATGPQDSLGRRTTR